MSNEKSFNNDKGFRKLFHDIFSPDIEVIGKAVEEIQERIDRSKPPYGMGEEWLTETQRNEREEI